MTTVVELDVPATELGLDGAFDRVPDLEFRLAGTIGDSPPLVYVSGPEREAVESGIEADDSVELLARIDVEGGDRWLYRLDFGREFKVFQHLVSEDDGTILEASGRDRRWSVRLLFDEREALSRYHASLEAYGFRAEITRVSTMDGDLGDRTPLTETQYETILKAYELGYFEVPRGVTLKELASELDVSHQALSERLRRSNAALVNAELSNGLSPVDADS